MRFFRALLFGLCLLVLALGCQKPADTTLNPSSDTKDNLTKFPPKSKKPVPPPPP
jgi:hypothetical protein